MPCQDQPSPPCHYSRGTIIQFPWQLFLPEGRLRLQKFFTVMAFSLRSRTTFGLPQRNDRPLELAFDLNSFVRQAPYDERDKPINTAQHRLWLDMSHLDTSTMQQIDEKYNSNMWKNFKFVRPRHSANYGKQSSPEASRGLIAEIYPLTLPKPSSIGENTYHKFLQETKLPKNKHKIVGWQKQGKEHFQSRILKVKSQCRAPPIDWEGNILPPTNYKRYPRPQSDFSNNDWQYLYPSYSSPAPSKMQYTLPDSPYSRQGTPWRYGLRVRRPIIEWN